MELNIKNSWLQFNYSCSSASVKEFGEEHLAGTGDVKRKVTFQKNYCSSLLG